MLKKQITYIDYNGNARTEEYTFNLSRLELMKMNKDYSDRGGLTEAFNKAVSENNEDDALNIFIDIIKRSYGERSEDGRHLEKSEELSEAFLKTEAFNALFDELTTDSKAVAAFFQGILPVSLQNGIPSAARLN